jgi:hypothetical protein
MSAIEVGKDLNDLLKFYQAVVNATEKGELDDELIKLSEARSAMRKGKKRGRKNDSLRDEADRVVADKQRAASAHLSGAGNYTPTREESGYDEDEEGVEVDELERVSEPEARAAPTVLRKRR